MENNFFHFRDQYILSNISTSKSVVTRRFNEKSYFLNPFKREEQRQIKKIGGDLHLSVQTREKMLVHCFQNEGFQFFSVFPGL